jgi:integrase
VKPRLSLVAPITEMRTVPPKAPGRRPNAELRTREHLTGVEVARLMEAVKDNRHGHRDATMVLLAYRHGLRASELCDLRWDQCDFSTASIHIRRVKKGTPATHPLTGLELRALRKLQRESTKNPFIFVSERGTPFTTAGFARLLERAAEKAEIEIKVHPHMACVRLQAGKRWHGYAFAPGIPGTQKYSAHGALYGTLTNALQRFLEGLGTPAASAREWQYETRWRS